MLVEKVYSENIKEEAIRYWQYRITSSGRKLIQFRNKI